MDKWEAPKISVILPVYNVSKYLRKSYESICLQKYANLEIIYVNDGSTDDSEKIIQEIKSKDSRISLYNKLNEGVGIARNYGLKKATGEFVYFMDPDDTLTDMLFEDFSSLLLEIKKIEVFVFGYNINNNGNITQKNWNPSLPEYISLKNDIYNLLNNSLLSPIWNKIYSRTFLENNKIVFSAQKNGQDVLFNLECFKHVKKCYVVDTIYYEYNIFRQGSLTETYYENRFNDRVNVIEQTENLFKQLGTNEETILRNRSKLVYVLIDEVRNLNNSKLSKKNQINLFKNYLNKFDSPQYKKVSVKDMKTIKGKVSLLLLRGKLVHVIFFVRRFI